MIYEYECPGDGGIIEINRGINEPEQEYYCGTCGAMMRRIYRSTPVIFNGSGFYKTDNSK